MGIAQFFNNWFRKNFGTSITNLKKNKTFLDLDISIDNLIIDMNGLFHNSTQKIYEYGNFKRNIRFLDYKKQPKNQIDVFIDVCKNIEELFNVVKPSKRLILMVDGPAPKCKLNQQRQRRYRSAVDREEDDTSFDTSSISPGTKFMDNLGKYVDWYIKKRLNEDSNWQKVEVIFSNDKVPSEGEQKGMSFIRKYCDKNESFVIMGNDADLIMLSLATHIEKFYVLRDNTFYDKDEDDKFLIVNIGHTALQLSEIMRWNSHKYHYSIDNAIDDFVLLCFMLGNDFIPHIPGIEIIEGGIDTILNVYRDIGTFNGHITYKTDKGIIMFNKIPLKIFLQIMSEYEKPVLEHKLKNKKIYFEDKLLESCAENTENIYVLDIDKYRKEYCKQYFGSTKNAHLEKICHTYLEGLQFVMTYYTNNVPSWNWSYPHYYAPSTYILSKYIDTFIFRRYEPSTPLLPFQQLLYILHPKSFNLLPKPLDTLYEDPEIEEFYPEKVEIDLAGKKNDWQGIVLLPPIELEEIKKIHNEHYHLLDIRDIKRNTHGRTFKYIYMPHYNSIVYKSYYGDINNYKIRTVLIDI